MLCAFHRSTNVVKLWCERHDTHNTYTFAKRSSHRRRPRPKPRVLPTSAGMLPRGIQRNTVQAHHEPPCDVPLLPPRRPPPRSPAGCRWGILPGALADSPLPWWCRQGCGRPGRSKLVGITTCWYRPSHQLAGPLMNVPGVCTVGCP
jgi:hypothetical protein